MVVAIDSSGHGNNGIYDSGPGYGMTYGHVGLVAGDYAVEVQTLVASPPQTAIKNIYPFTTGWWLANNNDFYLRGWISGTNIFNSQLIILSSVANGEDCRLELSSGGVGFDQVVVTRRFGAGAGGLEFGSTNFLTLPHSGTHQIAATYQQSTKSFRCYIDGTQVGTTFIGNGIKNGTGVGAATNPDTMQIVRPPPTPASAVFDEIDFGPVWLSSAQIASDYAAAAGGISGYNTAVLSRGPWGYFHLNNPPTPTPPPPRPSSIDVHELFIPEKTNPHAANWREIELWANRVRQELNP